MRRPFRARRFLKVALLSAGAGLLLLYALAFALFNDHTLARFVSNQVNPLIRGQLAAERLHYRFRLALDVLLGQPTPVDVTGLTISDPTGNPIITIPRGTVSIK